MYSLPMELRTILKNPLGELLLSKNPSEVRLKDILVNSTMIITVGDATTDALLRLDIDPDIYIIDGKETRLERPHPKCEFQSSYEVKNPPGTLSKESLAAIISARDNKKPVRILVDGEEDLLVLPFVATYPMDTCVLYGQPGEGIVVVKLNELIKKKCTLFLKKMGIEVQNGQNFL